MKASLRRFWVLAAGIVLVLVSAVASASPFLNSRQEPHAVLYLNVQQMAKQIWPVQIWAVDGKLSNRVDQGVLWVKPGDYSFNIRVGRKVNLDSVASLPGLARSTRYGTEHHVLQINLEAGKAYYIGAKFAAPGKWQPEVWKTEDIKN